MAAHWKKTLRGYALPSRNAELFKQGKSWIVRVGDSSKALGHRASFDTADAFVSAHSS